MMEQKKIIFIFYEGAPVKKVGSRLEANYNIKKIPRVRVPPSRLL